MTRADVMAFIDDALARGLSPDEIIAAIDRDPALMRAASICRIEDTMREMGDPPEGNIPEPPEETDAPAMMTSAELLDFLKRRKGKQCASADTARPNSARH